MYKIVKTVSKTKTLEVNLTEAEYDVIFDGLVELRDRNIEKEQAQEIIKKLRIFIFDQDLSK
jgi:hypothetical protein